MGMHEKMHYVKWVNIIVNYILFVGENHPVADSLISPGADRGIGIVDLQSVVKGVVRYSGFHGFI